jgi:hypothetical protein
MSTVARKPHRDLVFELRALGALCQEQGDLLRAEQHYRAALSLYDSSHQDDHLDATICLFGLVEVLRARGREAEARQFEETLERMNERRRSDWGGGSWNGGK